jgi:hypothetical protein
VQRHGHEYLHIFPAQELTSSRCEIEEFIGGDESMTSSIDTHRPANSGTNGAGAGSRPKTCTASELTARAVALTYNWWSWYVRAANPKARLVSRQATYVG